MLLEIAILVIAILVIAILVIALTRLLFAEPIAKKFKHIPKGTLDGDSPVEISETTVFICMTSKGVYHDRGCFHLKDHLKNAKKYDVCSECEKFPGTAIFISKKDTLHYHHTDGHIKDYLKGAKKYELCVDCNNLRQLRKRSTQGDRGDRPRQEQECGRGACQEARQVLVQDGRPRMLPHRAGRKHHE